MSASYHIYPLGDHAITIELGDRIDSDINEHCIGISELLHRQNIYGVKDIVPAYTTVSVVYDPAEIFRLPNIISPYQYIRSQVEAVIADYQPSRQTSGRTMNLPACFDLSFAPDLASMAEEKNTGIEQLIGLFLSRTYRVYMIGFLPGFAYMGKVDDLIATPRKQRPHPEVKAGSIGIAGNQTGIYPLASPGGWNIIGRTPVRLFNKDAAEPCLLKAGDEIVFQQVSIDTFHHLNRNN